MIDKEQAELTRLGLLGILSEAKPEEREQTQAAAGEMRAIMAKYGDNGKVALTLVLCEMAAKGEFL